MWGKKGFLPKLVRVSKFEIVVRRNAGMKSVATFGNKPKPGTSAFLQQLSEGIVALQRAKHAVEFGLEPIPEPEPEPAAPPSKRLEDVERAHIESVIAECNGNLLESARVLAMGKTTLYRKLKEWRESGAAAVTTDMARSAQA